jgi:hypothetical protein
MTKKEKIIVLEKFKRVRNMIGTKDIETFKQLFNEAISYLENIKSSENQEIQINN